MLFNPFTFCDIYNSLDIYNSPGTLLDRLFKIKTDAQW